MNPPSMIERPQWYVKRFPNPGLAAGLPSLGLELRTDTDSVFRMTGIAVYVFNAASAPLGAAGNVGQTIRFTRPDGTWLQKHILSAQAVNPYDSGAVNGAGGQSPTFYSYFSALGTNIFYPAGSAIQIDLVALAGITDALVLVVFVGTKLLPAGQAWSPDYSPASRKRPFYGYSVQVLGSLLPTTNVPLQVQPDAGFVWQHGQQTDGCAPPASPPIAGDLTGPEQIALAAAVNQGSFFFNRPNVFVNGKNRFAFVLDTKSNPWRLRAYLRDNSNGTWAEQDAGNGPAVSNGNVSTGFTTVLAGGYTAGSGLLNVVSTVGSPAFVGAPPFSVVVGNPFGVILAQLTVTGINSPTQFAVAPFGVDNNAPAGTGVFQVGIVNPLDSPFACPTYIYDPLDRTQVVAAYAEQMLSQLSFVSFSMGTKKWGVPVSGGPQVFGVDLTFGATLDNDDTGAKTCIEYRASDNRFLFNFQGPHEVLANNCLRPYFVTYDRTGASWGVAVPLAGAGENNPYEAHGIVVDPITNRAHCTVIKPTNGLGVALGSTYEIWHVAVDADNTIHPKNLATDTVLRFREPEVGYPVLRSTGPGVFELLVPFTQNSLLAATRRAAVVRAPLAIMPAWVTEIMNADPEKGPINQDFSAPSIAVGADGLPYGFWPGAPSSGLEIDLWSAKGGKQGVPWATPLSLFSVDPNAGGFMDFLSVSPLPGLGTIGIVSFDFKSSPDMVAYFELAPCQVGIMKGIGLRIKDWQGKYYMNDFVPAELIFGFDNSQTPGLPYPEIYIPKQQALYLDLAPFGPINGLLTLTFKGMKVYE